jgi:hypothetical protein
MEGRIALPEGLSFAMRWLCALLASAMLCAGLVACGGSGKGKGTAGPASSTGTAASTTPSTTRQSGAESSPSSANAATASGTSDSGTSGSSALGVPNGDQDGDSPNDKAFDKDDSFVTTFGHAAGVGDRKAITQLVTRYYAAIAKDDGATACRLLFFVITESAPETYGQTSFDATAGRGKRCGPVMSKVFKGNQAQLVAENRHVKVMAIRIQGKRAWVLLRFGPESVRRMIVYREGNSWKIGELLDTELV